MSRCFNRPYDTFLHNQKRASLHPTQVYPPQRSRFSRIQEPPQNSRRRKCSYEARSILMSHKYYVQRYDIYSPWRLGTQNLCTPNVRYIYTYSAQIRGAWSPEQQNFLICLVIISSRFVQLTEIRIGSHATSRQCQIKVRFTVYSRTVGHLFGTCSMPTFWRLKILGYSEIFGK